MDLDVCKYVCLTAFVCIIECDYCHDKLKWLCFWNTYLIKMCFIKYFNILMKILNVFNIFIRYLLILTIFANNSLFLRNSNYNFSNINLLLFQIIWFFSLISETLKTTYSVLRMILGSDDNIRQIFLSQSVWSVRCNKDWKGYKQSMFNATTVGQKP